MVSSVGARAHHAGERKFLGEQRFWDNGVTGRVWIFRGKFYVLRLRYT